MTTNPIAIHVATLVNSTTRGGQRTRSIPVVDG
jgi:hypothetical protein